MNPKTLNAKEIAKKFNIPYHTVNYYTMIGLLPIMSKSGNKRVYDEGPVITRLERIFEMIKEGYPLTLIRKKLDGV